MTASDLLDALRSAATAGDVQAILFLPVFERWVTQSAQSRTP